MSVLKLISRFLGRTVISISMLVFITSFVIIALTNNLDTLKSSINSEELLEEMLASASEGDLTLDEIKQICDKNPDQEECDIILRPSKFFDESFGII
jgi:hypothetical protein